ncbi:MAG TPA: DNA primase [Pyrinomonadaceae bacterium]|nr:DNA primase [Pyrinomonadaceae bacterium]
MRYPQTFIDDLRRQADIVRVIQDYVPLKKKGANWMACCPFHKEKTPSFSVSPAKEIFYCFGCHKGGSVFNFVMEVESVPFPEAIKIVAEKSGVPLPKLLEDTRFEAKRQEADEVIDLNRWAMEWWEQQLASGGPETRVVREYLKKREISEETQKTFRLGYSPDSWEAMSSYLRQKGALQAQIDRSGLVVKKEDGSGSYDRFRGRLMFPVMDIQGRPIAFGGRTLKADDNVKYINSPETAAYVKGRNLFGLNLTRDEIRKQGFAILVEGFLDLIVPFQFGIRNAVASLGTALTTDQVKLLGRFARRVVVNYDGDHAGVQAAKRAIEMLLEEDLEVKVLVLPNKSDPDEFIRQQGVSEYQQLRGKAQPHIQFVIDQAVADRNLHRPAEKAEAVEEVLPYVRAVRNRIQKREYFDIAVDALRVTDQALKRELWYSIRSGASAGDLKKKLSSGPRVKPTVAEQRLLELLFADEQLRPIILPRLTEDVFVDLPTAGVFQALIKAEKSGADLDYSFLSQETEGDATASELVPLLLMSDSLLSEEQTHEGRKLSAERCIETLRLMKVDRRIDELRTELAAAERNGDSERIQQLVNAQLELTKQRAVLGAQAAAEMQAH